MKKIMIMFFIVLPILLILLSVVWDIFVREYFVLKLNNDNFQEIIEILEKDGFNAKNLQNTSTIKVKINPFMSVNSDEYHLEYYDINGNRIIGGGEIKELNEDEYAIINYLKKNSLDISKLQSNLLKISIIFSIVTIVYSFLLKIKK